MSVPDIILELVARFEQQYDTYRSGNYNETQLRRDFLDPLFKALGWDMDNVAGYAEAYRDVIHEDAIRIGSRVKAPDYCFRIGGTRKFFVEAKKPAVDIRGGISPAYQLRRYAWSAKLALSLLSDFEEIAVYDCRVKPRKDDSASAARVFYCTFRQLPEQWNWLVSIFSREAVLQGSFDKYAGSNKAKRGTAEVDADFLASMEAWRQDLARNLALRNQQLSQRELNFAVQRTLDRIVFLRICEDRGLEDYGRLLALTNGGRIYPRLCEHFEQADTRYNSGLFHFHAEKGRSEPPDSLTPNLNLDDALLRNLIKGLYYPDSPYEFSVISADILGQVYEQFLGKVIRLTGGHRAVVDEKPEVRKAGGVYYTPTYVAEYIVQQTLGRLVGDILQKENGGREPRSRGESAPGGLSSDGGAAPDSPDEAGSPSLPFRVARRVLDRVAALRVLDPACGSGSFLICAYQFLFDWHLRFYLANDPERWARGARPALIQASRGWRLTIAERKRILLNNIFGVDIDPQAVEVTKLSLLLKVLEGETTQSVQSLFTFLHERALPDLGANIRCGNSLIGPDFYDQPDLPALTEDDRLRLNVFDWAAEFPRIFTRCRPSAELRETPADLADYTLPGIPLHGRYGDKKVKHPSDGSPVPAREPAWEGGFDAVIGNPPYVRIQTMRGSQPQEVEFFGRAYAAAGRGNYDLYVVFVERGLHLLSHGGRLGFIIPNKFTNAQYGEALRDLLARGEHVERLVHFGDQQVFTSATTYTCLLFLSRARCHSTEVIKVSSLESWRRSAAGERVILPPGTLRAGEWDLEAGPRRELRGRLARSGDRLRDVAQIFVGLQTSADRVFVIHDPSLAEAAVLRPFLTTGRLRAYQEPRTGSWMIFPYEVSAGRATLIAADRMRREFPKAWAYLESHEAVLRARDRGRWDHAQWYAFGRSQNLAEMEQDKLVIQVTAIHPTVLLDRCGLCMSGGGAGPFYGIRPLPSAGLAIEFLLGLLNSKVFGWVVRSQSTPLRGGYIKFSKQYIATAPIPRPRESLHDRLVALVTRMLESHRQLAAARTPHERTALERQIAATNNQIDRLVHELYGLTAAEIALVEAASGGD
ncbi:MAG: Eco57I restriction-modification methylase domain-containing protein [Verrucomicrobiales bacterium]|nr:Eco57I restriction-modification methylase domain-containing protein [Verrucomicrobiales bacterium]MCP5526143.1 Eco57I restriction-modification methylase domain-containing protein [Verrucomicrobiales bacterium]